MRRAEKLDRGYLGRILMLTLLAPDIVEAILDGRQPEGMTLPGPMAPYSKEVRTKLLENMSFAVGGRHCVIARHAHPSLKPRSCNIQQVRHAGICSQLVHLASKCR